MAKRRRKRKNTITVYKICDLVNSEVKTLFHGLEGSRVMPFGVWMDAEKKRVRDGTSKTWYISGFHIFRVFEDALQYLEMFQHQEHKAIVRCEAQKLRPKAHSPSPTELADRIRFDHVVWTRQQGDVVPFRMESWNG